MKTCMIIISWRPNSAKHYETSSLSFQLPNSDFSNSHQGFTEVATRGESTTDSAQPLSLKARSTTRWSWEVKGYTLWSHPLDLEGQHCVPTSSMIRSCICYVYTVCVCVYRVCVSADPSPQQGGGAAWAGHVVQWLPQNVAHALAVSHAMVFWCAESIFEATSERMESESYYRHWQRLWAAGTIRPSLPWCFGVTSEDFL